MERFVVVQELENGLPVVMTREYATQKEAVQEAKKIKNSWVESRGGDYDGEVAWMPR